MAPKRDFLAVSDLSRDELTSLITAAGNLKRSAASERPLAGRSVGLLFSKSSTRTRVSFEVGAFQLGAHPVFLSLRDIQLGRGEPMRDTARVLSRYLDALVIRTHAHAEAEDARRAHADFYLALAERTEPRLTGPAQAAGLDQLEAEHDNLRTALNWSLGAGGALAVRLVGALWRF